MPSCSIKNCRGTNRNVPNWTLHKLPTNEKRKNQWLDIIGEENINFKMKYINICSIHFEESCFNRTLNITKLHDDAVPSRALIPTHIRANSLDASSEQSFDDVEDRRIFYNI